MVLVQNWPILLLIYLVNISQENAFHHIIERKNATFLSIKTRSSKSRKIDIFLKVLVHGFGPKLPISSRFYFSQYKPRKCVFWYSKIKKINSLGYKNKKVKSRKIHIFLKRLVHGFGGNFAIFATYFLRQYRPGKCVSRYYGTKKPTFKAIKSRSPISRKMDVFPKGLVHGFGLKLTISQPFYFRQYRPGKCILCYCRQNNNFLNYKNKKLKRRKIDIFPKPMVLVQNWPFSHLFILAI